MLIHRQLLGAFELLIGDRANIDKNLNIFSFPKEFPVGLRARSSQAATLLAEVSETIE